MKRWHNGLIPSRQYSAYLTCYNNAATLRLSAESVLAQTCPPAEVLAIDDGSTDGCADRLAGLPIRVIRHDRNLGRGAARARAMSEVRHELVLSCDSTLALAPAFIESVLPWLADPKVAGVYGRIVERDPPGAVERWRGRHLFKFGGDGVIKHGAPLITGGTVVRASAVKAAGGYDARLRHSEDADLGGRLLGLGYDVICDPRLEVFCIGRNTVSQVLERYWRWRAGKDELATWGGYWERIRYSVRRMAVADLRAGDPAGMLISLIAPHYGFWHSRASLIRLS